MSRYPAAANFTTNQRFLIMKQKIMVSEIDIIGMLQKVLRRWKLLCIYMLVGAVVGVVVALNTPKWFKANVVLAPELISGSMGLSESLSDMASSFGLDLGGKGKQSMDAIYPQIYPDLFASTDFIIPLFSVNVVTKDGQKKTYLDHLVQDLKIPFWQKPKLWVLTAVKKLKERNAAPGTTGIGKMNPFRLTEDEEQIVDMVRGSIGCQIDKKTNVINISIADPDPQVAAIMVDTLQVRLQAYITQYRTKKARADERYYTKLQQESKEAYLKAQKAYADFADSNQDAILASVRSQEDELENEMQLKFNVYSQIQTQVQQARAKVQEQTPAFTIIEKATVPNKPSSTPRSMILLLFIVLSACLHVVWVLIISPARQKKCTQVVGLDEE